ncbi:hypothetical protein [Nonomuraea sp. NPDC049625]|uniref:hypothetical protein n=1 Tax=Nonomuraea sp. NPDC049625 TaxID=3155775 RepID=UPI00342D4E69
MISAHAARSSAEFAAAWWANYLCAPDVEEGDLAEVDPATAVLEPTIAVMPASAVDEGVISQEQVSRLFTGIAERVRVEVGHGRRVRLQVSRHAVDAILGGALADAEIDLSDGRLAFALPSAAMEITHDAVVVQHAYTTDPPQIVWQPSSDQAGS